MTSTEHGPTSSPSTDVRRDKRGRRIGHNWWREMNVSLLWDATHLWETECEATALGYDTEEAEFAASHPRPNLRQFLLANKGYAGPPE